jgi:hypothetical protein
LSGHVRGLLGRLKGSGEPRSLAGRYSVALLTGQVELRRQYAARFHDIPNDESQVIVLGMVFRRLLENYLRQPGATSSALIDEMEARGGPVPPRDTVEAVFATAADGDDFTRPEGLRLGDLVSVETGASYLMVRQLRLSHRQVIDLVMTAEKHAERLGIALHPA